MSDDARRASRVTLSASALAHNWNLLGARLPAATGMLAMVKANAYGHGDVALARRVRALGAVGVGVADLGEALALRAGGYDGPILSMGLLTDEALAAARDQDLALTVHSAEECAWLADRGAAARVHIKIDTGMNRWGLRPDETAAAVDRLAGVPALRVEGVMTHLSESDTDPDFTRKQLAAFARVAPLLKARWPNVVRHAANSGAILSHPAAHLDWVRPGIALYGYPAGAAAPEFRPVLEWRARIGQVKKIASGERVGYNRAFLAPGPMTVGTVGVGYGDGYQRNYAGIGIGYRGDTLRTVGAISMDALAVDLTRHPEARAGDEVVLIGGAAGEPTAQTLAAGAGTIAYEVLTNIHERVPRSFVP